MGKCQPFPILKWNCCAFSTTLLTWWQTPLFTVNAWVCVCVRHVSMTNASHGCQQAVIPHHRDKPLYNTAENVIRCCQINFTTFHQTDHQMTGGQPWHSHTSQCPLEQLYSQGWENMTPMWMPFPTHSTAHSHNGRYNYQKGPKRLMLLIKW